MVEVRETEQKRQKTDKFDPIQGLINVNYTPEILNAKEEKIGG